MAEVRDLLVEIGTEELPPKDLKRLSEALAAELQRGLADASLSHGTVTEFGTPRRLAVLVEDLIASQPERQAERRGPALAVAFDAEGRPTRAAEGFARSCGVDVQHLERLETDKGAWLVHRTTEEAQLTVSLLAAILGDALERLPIGRRMRWGALDAQFVRPVQWVILLFGDTVVDAEILGVRTTGQTRGHRFHHPQAIPIASPRDYSGALYGTGHVIAEFARRRSVIAEQLQATAREVGGTVLDDEALLDEVTAMVEWPVAITGRFDEEFLELPRAALIATMKGHQRYFPLVDAEGALLPFFITVANIDSHNPEAVRVGNERVIRPRLKDAAFFVENDLKLPLEERLETLGGMVFQEKLGTLAEKSRRVAALSRHVAVSMGEPPGDVKHAVRAGLLCKCDLVTDMVGEFPELQGFMGRHYAERGGEPPPVAVAIEEAYRPRFAGDAIPATRAGCAVAIADKLDTLAGIFGIGLQPTGDRDPFALRRAALGVLRVIIEADLDVDLRKLLAAAVAGYPEPVRGEKLADELFDFMVERLRAYFLERGVPPDVFAAVQSRQPTRPLDFARRIRAVHEFRGRPESASLAAANKRIQNILRQADVDVPLQVDDTLLREDAEWNLAAKLVGIGPRVNEMLRAGDYTSAMTHLAGLRETIDAFFDTVKVMDDDQAIKRNRLALLNNVGSLFLQTADISQLQS